MSNQLDLLADGFNLLVRETFAKPQDEHLVRVGDRIGSAIIRFFEHRDAIGKPVFYMADLLAHVKRECGEVAPDSPGRVMRMLRRKGRIAYTVTSRRDSEYTIEGGEWLNDD